MIPKIKAIMVKVEAAFFAFGFLKKGTELEMASTPVREADPLVKALNKRMMLTPEMVWPTCAVAL